MTGDRLSIVAVSSSATGGGAEAVARRLVDGFGRHGHDARLMVGRGGAEGGRVQAFPSDLGTGLAHFLAGTGRLLDRWRGLESYRYPATRRLLDGLPRSPDLIHLHNLHGGYFDLRVLPSWSASVPVVLTLHDAWLLSGHCAHSLGCERWRTGCGACPDLDIYPAVRRDATARNWMRKRDIFARSRLHVATPSVWLADRVRHSMLAPAARDVTVIPNGVDLATFHPADRLEARSRLGLSSDASVLLFVGRDTGDSGFKDLATAERAAARAGDLLDRELTLVVLGGGGAERRTGRVRVRPVPFQSDPARVAWYHQAADLLLHAARADTFPSTVLEALACGTPVVASAVGGIPEQVRGLPLEETGPTPMAGATGVLVPPADPAAMAVAVARVLGDASLRRTLAENARRDAERRFDFDTQCRAYLDWFRAILSGEHGGRSDSGSPPVDSGRDVEKDEGRHR